MLTSHDTNGELLTTELRCTCHIKVPKLAANTFAAVAINTFAAVAAKCNNFF